MFIGRTRELEFLNKCYNSSEAEFVVLYGRRRVGKTDTLTEFCKDKPHVFYLCREYTDNQQRAEFSKALLSFSEKFSLFPDTFADWNKAFAFLSNLQSDRKTVVVIDEFPYMCKSNKSIPSVLQIAWDTVLRRSNIMLVLCGSSMSFIEDELLAKKNPLYGRTTGIYKMMPMPYYDAVKFVPDFSDEEKLTTCTILGGIPHYLKRFDSHKSLSDNIIDEILTKGRTLYTEVEFLIHQELRETSVYNTIIDAIALGNSSLNDIFTKTNIEKTKLSVYLKNLIELGLVEKEFPVLTSEKEHANNNRGLYNLTDNYFRFWYAFCYGNLAALEQGECQETYDDFIADNLHDFCGRPFEKICVEYLYALNKQKQLPFRFTQIGRWWGKVTKDDESGKLQTTSEEIDIVAADKSEKNFIVGECKFTNEPFDLGQLKALQHKNPFAGNVYYYLFSLNGFTDGVKQYATDNPNVVLVTAHDILDI